MTSQVLKAKTVNKWYRGTHVVLYLKGVTKLCKIAVYRSVDSISVLLLYSCQNASRSFTDVAPEGV